jgi:hypothetical protein
VKVQIAFKRLISQAIAALAVVVLVPHSLPLMAADHAEAPLAAADPGADIADVFAFLDPNDNSKVILALDVEGFVVPSEMSNLSFFAPGVVFRFEIENKGGVIADQKIDITFSKQTSRSAPQTATVLLPNGRIFTAPTTVPTLASAANPFVVTTDSRSGVSFFAGLTDDPFYFDIVGFNRFVTSVLAGTPDVTTLQRGRDSFAGYNIHMIALSVPAELLQGPGHNPIIGVNGVTLRRSQTGANTQVDRMATPAVNTALIPYPRKDEYNASHPFDDAQGKFAGDIVATLKALGTNDENIGILAGIAVTKGDYLRLNLTTANSSLGMGESITSPHYTGFPNGRRPGDAVIHTLLYLITNHAVLNGDSVMKNDVPLGTEFPFFAPPHQPQAHGVIDDDTRN